MRRSIITFLISSLLATSFLQGYEPCQDTHRLGKTAQESTSTAVNLSMLGWGLGLAAAIAILAAVVHQSQATTVHE